jgi:prophage tail gpP-like protein
MANRKRIRSGAAPRRRALAAVSQMRKGKSLTRAAKLAHTTPGTVKRYAPKIVVQPKSGRYEAKPYDQLTREMRFLTPKGVTALPIRSSASASRIGEYWNEVDRYVRTGRSDGLRRFRNKSVTVRGKRHPFVTDEALLDRLANAGEVRFEDLYALAT